METTKIGSRLLDGNSWGQKASRLAIVNGLGFTTPSSWALSCDDLLTFLRLSNLQHMARYADRCQEAYEETLLRLRCQVEAQEVSEVLLALLEGCIQEEPHAKQWIIRSNHSGEDGHDHSFAGVFHSTVVSASVEAMVTAIKEVAMQAYSWSVQMQILQAGIDPLRFRPGILIQPFVQAACSGVYFSRNPNNPWMGEALCEWTAGGAKELVEGEVSGNQTILRADRLPEEKPLDQVALEGRRIAKALDCAVDCEWVWDGKTLFWVQARPIADQKTKLANRLNPSDVLSRADMKERFPEPLSRMGWSVLDKIIAANLRSLEGVFGLVVPDTDQLVVNLSGTIYSNREFFQLKGVKWKKRYAARLLRPLRLFSIARDFLRHRNRKVLTLRLKDLYLERPLASICGQWKEAERLADLERIASLANGSDKELAEAFSQLESFSQVIFSNDMATFVLREAYYSAFKDILGSDAAVQQLLNGERKINQELYSDCEALKRLLPSEQNPQFFVSLEEGHIALDLLDDRQRLAWDGFMRRWGTMNDSWDVMKPSWQEDPRRLHAFFSMEMVSRPAASKQAGEADACLERYGLKALFSKLVDVVKTDDEEHYFGAHILSLARRLIVEAGMKLTQKGVLTSPDQVFGLTVNEARTLLVETPKQSFAPYAAAHLQAMVRAQSQTQPEVLNRPETLDPKSSECLGTPVSAGRVEGTLRLVLSTEDLKQIDPDTILALISPNPAYIPLFGQIKGLVCETGGLLSHSFVVAREIMLPAVTQVKGLATRFRSGDRVVIDGATGQIERVE